MENVVMSVFFQNQILMWHKPWYTLTISLQFLQSLADYLEEVKIKHCQNFCCVIIYFDI